MTNGHKFCWAELMTDDILGSKKFYKEVFGWEYKAEKMDNGEYIISYINDIPVIGLFQKWEEHKDIPNNWGTYVQVENVDEKANQIKEFGGSVFKEPFDIPQAGRMAVVADTEKAFFSLWEQKCEEMPKPEGLNGVVCWNELGSHDVQKAKDFYSKCFNSKFSDRQYGESTYTTFLRDGEDVGGAYQMPPYMNQIPAHWLIYFKVEDCHHTEDLIKKIGGQIIKPSETIEGVGTFSVVSDPFKAVFGIISNP